MPSTNTNTSAKTVPCCTFYSAVQLLQLVTLCEHPQCFIRGKNKDIGIISKGDGWEIRIV